MEKRNALFPTLSRTSPVLFFILIVLNCMINPSYESFYLFIMYFIECISNHAFKKCFKFIYNLINTKSLPILGTGSRPPNANSCAFILDNSISKSYGMPSGHSQTAWTVATYLICKIIQKFKSTKNITFIDYIWIVGSCIILLGSAIYISYSRLYIEGCHTIQQVIVGGIIGIAFGYVIYYFENDAINLLSKLYNKIIII
jgi:membrane-associated phospholipid phosphatase